jgi:hypothetical protein
MANLAGCASGGAAGLVLSETSQKIPALRSFRHGYKGFNVLGALDVKRQREARARRTRKTVITGARLAVEEAKRGGFRGRWCFATLTYREDVTWLAQQMSAFTDHLRQYAKRSGFKLRYVWALEMTKRGRPHYHLCIWLPKGRTLPKPDKRGWWPHGCTNVKWARNAVGYLAKYASKGVEDHLWKCIPKGARMCGHGGISPDGRMELRYWKLPTWVRAVFDHVTDVKRSKGGFIDRDTGEYLASPYRVVFKGGAMFLLKREGAPCF